MAFVGTYPPRQCGIATFTRDLAAAVSTGAPDRGADRTGSRVGPGRPLAVEVVAVDYEPRDFPPEVRLRVDPDRPADYVWAADRLNRSGVAAVSLQHEFGIYGGTDGELILNLIDELDVPLISTLHTVLSRPSDRQREIVRRVAAASSRIVVLARSAGRILADAYDVDPGRIRVVPHGVPDLPFVDPEGVKPLVGLAGRPTILSFGLLGPGKGYELAIRAMAHVVKASPAACYVILGATHPELRRREGETYRHALQALAQELDLGDHVRFVDEYVDLPTLVRWLQAADVFVTPYPGAEQAVSGTLAYALGTGKALVSTPYAYARELLADGRGELVPFGDSEALGRALGTYLTNGPQRELARRRAYALGRSMTWERVGAEYRRILAEVWSERQRPWEQQVERGAPASLTPEATSPG
ncbi:MAG TPA: glycosyltransferase family 4 protein [Candidatus Limnocylindrales bacterium]|nr:glycosyltransferase family 4 protein [Candidatus Limnocylindrales bacterium]